MEIDGTPYFLNTDFRAGIAYTLAAMRKQPIDRQWLLDLFFPVEQPPAERWPQALEAINCFCARGRAAEADAESVEKEASAAVPPAYDFLTDADAMTAEFERQYHLDLTSATLHWWRFLALLEGLIGHSFSDRCRFRTADLTRIKDKTTRSIWRSMQERYRLGTNGAPIVRPQTLEELNDMLLRQARGEE